MKTAFWKELRQSTSSYLRWDLSIKQSLMLDGLSIFLNISNLTEANDVNRYMGSTTEATGSQNLASEQYYGKTYDLGFRYSF